MHRGFYVATVLVPLIFGSTLLIFGIFTEYWVRLDYSHVKKFTADSYNSETYDLKKVRFEFPKFSSLFDECNEYKIIEVLEPKLSVGSYKSKLSLFSDEVKENQSALFQPNEIQNQENANQNNEQDEIIDEEKSDSNCYTRKECNTMNPNENGSCFCCKSKTKSEEECCHPRSKLCDGVNDCQESEDELENCPLKKVFYSHSYYDNKHQCQRHQYTFFTFLKKALNLKERFSQNSTDTFCLSDILKSNNFTVRIFLLRLATLLSFGLCIIFTLLCLITALFVTCCHNLKDKKSDSCNNIDMYGPSAEDDEFHAPSSKITSCCCKCNCLLCPFVFYSAFSILAFVFNLFGLIVYIYSICFTRNAYLIFDSGFQPPQITKAYQYNPWLFRIQDFGISFYAILISFFLYMIMFICSTCITCRIQMSPEWNERNSSSYEVLQMNDIVYNNKKLEKAEKKAAKKAEKLAKKNKKKDEELANVADLENVDEFSDASGEHTALNRPKTNIQAIDNSYE